MAIITILIGLLLPAVQKIRESGNRVQCQNSLKPVGIVVQNHASRTGTLPTGGFLRPITAPLSSRFPAGSPPVGGWAPITGQEQNWSWVYQILPQLDQENVWAAPAGQEGRVQSLPLKIFSCPSRSEPTVYNNQFLSDYAGNAGWQSTYFANNATGLIVPKQYATAAAASPTPIKLSNVQRGLSNTLLASEKYVSVSRHAGGEFGDDVSVYYNFLRSNYRFGDDPGPFPDTTNLASSDPNFRFPFGSAHPVGVNALFGDGSVRLVRYGNSIIQTISNRLDRTPVTIDDQLCRNIRPGERPEDCSPSRFQRFTQLATGSIATVTP